MAATDSVGSILNSDTAEVDTMLCNLETHWASPLELLKAFLRQPKTYWLHSTSDWFRAEDVLQDSTAAQRKKQCKSKEFQTLAGSMFHAA